MRSMRLLGLVFAAVLALSTLILQINRAESAESQFIAFRASASVNNPASVIYRIGTDGQNLTRMTTIDPTKNMSHSNPTWSANGRALAFTQSTFDPTVATINDKIWRIHTMGQRTQRISHPSVSDSMALWNPNKDGGLLTVSSNTVYRYPNLNGATRQTILTTPDVSAFIFPRLSSDGSALYDAVVANSQGLRLVRVPLDGSDTSLWEFEGEYLFAAFGVHPDESQIAVVGSRQGSGNYIELLPLREGATRQRLDLPITVRIFDVAWSPDGQWLALATSAYDAPLFYLDLMRVDGSQYRRIYLHFDRIDDLAWSPPIVTRLRALPLIVMAGALGLMGFWRKSDRFA